MTAAVAKHLVSLLTQITIFSLYLSLTPIKPQCMFFFAGSCSRTSLSLNPVLGDADALLYVFGFGKIYKCIFTLHGSTIEYFLLA